jgi:hypothetical protein
LEHGVSKPKQNKCSDPTDNGKQRAERRRQKHTTNNPPKEIRDVNPNIAAASPSNVVIPAR